MSHSSKDNDFTEKICAHIKSVGAEDAPEVLVDFKTMDEGQYWDRQIHEWMGRCHAALIVLTTNAAESPWVLKESTILSQRKALEENFPVFVVRGDNVDQGRVTGEVSDKVLEDNKWSPLSLERLQELAEKDPAGIAEKILGSDVFKIRKTPFDRMTNALSGLLKKVETGELETVADKLNQLEPPPWSSTTDDRGRLVEAIARHLMCGCLGKYSDDGLETLIGDIGWSPGADDLMKILRALGPHWVAAEAAAPVGVLPVLTERRVVAINGDHVTGSDLYTAHQYVRRAHLADANRFKLWSVGGGNHGDLLAHYTCEICKQARKQMRRFEQADDDEIVEGLAKNRQATFYVVLPELPPTDVLHDLLARFPKLNFIANTSLDIDRERPLVDWLEPLIDLEVEDRWFIDWDNALTTIDNI